MSSVRALERRKCNQVDTKEQRKAFVENHWRTLAAWAWGKYLELGRGALRVWLSERKQVGDGYDYPVDYLPYWSGAEPGVNTNWPPDLATLNLLAHYTPENEVIVVFFKDDVVGQCDLYHGSPENAITPREAHQDEQTQREKTKTEYIALALLDDEIKVVSLCGDGRYRFLDDIEKVHNILYIVSSETVELQRAVEELEELINNSEAQEDDFQAFFERHSEFILDEEYKRAHPQIVLANEEKSLIPDFVLEPTDQESLCDLLELKRASAPVFVLQKNRARFSADVSEARAQLLEYRRFFDEAKNRDAIVSRYGLKSYKPRLFLVIGRLKSVDPITKRYIEANQPDLCVRTYDDVINRMKDRIERMSTRGLRILDQAR